MSRIEEPGKIGEIEGKTQGILLVQLVVGSNSLILKVNDMAIFAEEMSNILLEAGYVSKFSIVYVIVTNWYRGIVVRQEKTGKTQGI